MTVEHPEVFVLAGPNGAGKSTVAGVLLPVELRVSDFVNADFIAQALTPHAPETSAMEAGRMMLRRIRELRDARRTFAFESTLASRTFGPFLRDAQQLGYLVHIVYVSLRNADLAARRVRLRVSRGGHDIPEETVRRRFGRSLRNLFEIYLPLADGWSVWDNSGRAPLLVARGGAGQTTTIIEHEPWERLSKQGTSHGH